MNTTHAALFMFTGFLLFFIPAWTPADFTKLGPDGTCASALWLGVVGFVLHAIGLGWLLTAGLQRVRLAVETFDPVLPRFDATELHWSMPPSLFALVAWEKHGLRTGLHLSA